jgi:DNA repair exonuclease SbcCD ATPase subunit
MARFDADSVYLQDCQKVKANTQAIQSLTGQISKRVKMLAGPEDFERCRGLLNDATRIGSETRVILKRIQDNMKQCDNPSERNGRRDTYRKLSGDLQLTVKVLEDVMRKFVQEERRRSQEAKDEAQRHRPVEGDVALVDLHSGRLQRPEEAASQSSPSLNDGIQADSGLDAELKQERLEAWEQVSSDMKCLNGIYRDLAAAAVEQQETFDSLEHNIAQANHDLERGLGQITITADRYDRRRKHRLWAGIASVGALVVLYSFWS